MFQYTEKSFLSQNSISAHRIVYSDWGDENAPVIVCVHGLTGNGHDFDFLAPALVEMGYRVIAPDLPGRGRSDFLPDPMDYNYAQYCRDLVGLIDHIAHSPPTPPHAGEKVPEGDRGGGVTEHQCYPETPHPNPLPKGEGIQIDWLGVSLGGLLGIQLAGEKRLPIRRLILNDVGPIVPKPALDFIQMVISQTYTFDTIFDLEQRMRATRGLTWGPVTDEQWRYMAEHNARALDDGAITYAYDPNIAKVFETHPIGDSDLWAAWDNVECPTMLIHGKKSVVLTKPIIEEMRMRGPGNGMHYVCFDDCGHVPSLWADNQIAEIRGWLNEAI
jgi:pimeloyl-ACP methyl ester carboxylesterase